MVLEAKNLSYRLVEITPGIGQVSIFRLSGQRQLPLLIDGSDVIHDSSAIIRHLNEISPEPNLIPKDSNQASIAFLIEDWADTTMAKGCKKALIKAAANDSQLRMALLPEEVPSSYRKIIGELPNSILNKFSEFATTDINSELLASLEQLTNLIKSKKWIVGNKISFADIAVAAQLSLLKFPKSAGKELAGKGCPGFMDHPKLTDLFDWRDQLETSLMEVAQ